MNEIRLGNWQNSIIVKVPSGSITSYVELEKFSMDYVNSSE
jgi:hypothetical protein